MMNILFKYVLARTVVSSFVIPAILLLRTLFRGVPRKQTILLWIPLLFSALVPPITLKRTVSVETAAGIPAILKQVDGMVTVSQRFTVLPWLWFGGFLICLVSGLTGSLHLRRLCRRAIAEEDNIYLSEDIYSGLVLGLIHPVILLPMEAAAEEKKWIIAHEQTHLRQHDPFLKLLFFLILSLHWFNPLFYIAGKQFETDLEERCDEAVTQNSTFVERKEYAEVLLKYATVRPVWIFNGFSGKHTSAERRIRHLMKPLSPSRSQTILILTLTVLFTAACSLRAEEVPSPQKEYAETAVSISEEPSLSPIAEEKPEVSDARAEEPEAAIQEPVQEEQSPPGFIYPLANPEITCDWGCFAGHNGQDFTDPENKEAAVLAAADGTVKEVSFDVENGNYIIVDHGGGYYSLYSHLGSAAVSPGTVVVSGQAIGVLGLSGNSTGPHVHFAIRRTDAADNLLKHLTDIFPEDEIFML